MKHFVISALMVGLSVVGLSAQQRPIKMTYSGSIVATTIEYSSTTVTDEEQLAGNGTLGQFTFRKLRADETAVTFGSCGTGFGPNIQVAGGGGVFRFADGSLLVVKLTEGKLCVDLSDPNKPVGHLAETFQITGGTGRFKGAAASCGATPEACVLKATGTLGLVVTNAAGTVAKMLSETGELEGTLLQSAIDPD
jgi:hypothetical protein